MILIAHRGNFDGKKPELENTKLHINNALAHGYDVEVDLWKIGNEFFLGHDRPEHRVEEEYLGYISLHTWFHAKNLEALEYLLLTNKHGFFHDKDDYTLTTRGFIWAYSGKVVGKNGVACMPEMTKGFKIPANAYAVCSDNLTHIR